ncbi:hypothetical protein LTR62_008107 [Meristemomyces frigidus]|uniref:RING-type E3 ubiquitin transferase n=1 Tax=Meristemomyces frigidus TaxID=1508187 RepID=A0AAN7TB27_9PEZI|nr:hypothetical protein LTR62_008107 [Meristemomyces frigidus]
MRLGYYVGASTAAATGCLLKAFHQRPNFYSATVYLSQSNACLLILTNLCLVLACSLIYALQRVLYGPLRPIEIEQLSEKAWYAVLDTLLAMPSFREDVGGWLLCMFVLLLAGKVWGWIGEGRVDVLEQGQPIPNGQSKKWFHIRLATSLVLSVAFDIGMLWYCVESVMADPRPGMMVIFTFEFAVLAVFSSFTFSRYLLSLVQAKIEATQMLEAIEARKSEIRAERAAARQSDTDLGEPALASTLTEEPIEVDEMEVDVPGWEEKRRYLFFMEVLTDFVKLVIYIVFFTVSITFNGLPMHIMRDVYMTFASFSKRLTDFVAYRKATSDMNTRYPDATTEEIRGDACIVCRESMLAWEQPAHAGEAQTQIRRDEGLRAKKLPCGHILHLRCLKAWLERQQVCPTCRRPVIQAAETAIPGQPGAAPGAPAAAGPGAAGGERPRRNRARILNLGPLRIGFLNAPGDQMQQIINQMRNPQPHGQAAPQAPLNGAQQGPNHLGLQVPYAPGAAAAQGAMPRATVATQISLMQIEQRLLQDAHNLRIEQQQLATLRLMEAELARLRALQIPAEAPVGMGQRQSLQALAFQSTVPSQQNTLHGQAGSGMGPGHEALPAGMVVPEGWTVMPLTRNYGMPAAQVQVQPVQMPTQSPSGNASTVSGAPTIPASGERAPVPQADAPANRSQPPSSQPDRGPTDDQGSPFFKPTATASVPIASSARPATASTHAPTPTTSSSPANMIQQQSPRTDHPSSLQQPWSMPNDSGWNFNDSAACTQRPETSMEQQPSPNEEQERQSYSGKGKGRAVQVEDDDE